MRLAHSTFALAASAAFALAACSFAPSDAPPAMPSPAHYGAAPQPAHTVAAAGVAQEFDTGAPPPPQWWRLYQSDALDAFVDEGLRNSPTLAAAEKSLAAARQQLRAHIGSTMLPSVDAVGGATRERSLGLPEAGPDTVRYNVFVGEIQASYKLDLFGAERYATRAHRARVNVQAYQLDAARRMLAANIVSAAISTATIDRQITVTERLVELANETARDDESRYALGAISHSDALLAQQRAATLEAQLPKLRQQRAAAIHTLAVLMGRTPDAAPAVPDLWSYTLPAHVPVVVPSQLLRTRPDIQAADAAVKAASAQVGAATAQLFPDLSLTASMGQGGYSWPAALSGAGALWSVGAGLSQPVFHGGALLAQRRAALDAYDAATAQYKATVLSAFQNVADSLAALEQDAAALASTDAAQQAALQIFVDTAARCKLGSVPLTIERSSEQQYLSEELDAIRARGQRLADTASLFQAMGHLPEDSAMTAAASTLNKASHD